MPPLPHTLPDDVVAIVRVVRWPVLPARGLDFCRIVGAGDFNGATQIKVNCLSIINLFNRWTGV